MRLNIPSLPRAESLLPTVTELVEGAGRVVEFLQQSKRTLVFTGASHDTLAHSRRRRVRRQWHLVLPR